MIQIVFVLTIAVVSWNKIQIQLKTWENQKEINEYLYNFEKQLE